MHRNERGRVGRSTQTAHGLKAVAVTSTAMTSERVRAHRQSSAAAPRAVWESTISACSLQPDLHIVDCGRPTPPGVFPAAEGLLRLGDLQRLAGFANLKNDGAGPLSRTCVATDHRLVWQFVVRVPGGQSNRVFALDKKLDRTFQRRQRHAQGEGAVRFRSPVQLQAAGCSPPVRPGLPASAAALPLRRRARPKSPELNTGPTSWRPPSRSSDYAYFPPWMRTDHL